MKQKLLFISLLIIGLNCFSQDRIPGTYFTVLAPSGLNIREKPNQNSSISTTIPFGTEVKADFSKMIPATINGFTGGWVPVAYEGKDGYTWSQYLAEITIPRQENINNDFRVIQEGAFCGELNYMPDLTWYGIYKTNKPGIRELKKVEIEVVVKSTLKEDEKEAYFGEDNSNADFLIKTNSDRNSLFLIGSKKPMEEIQFYGDGSETIGNSGFLYPEQRKTVFFTGYDELEIKAKEAIYITDGAKCTFERKYELELSGYDKSRSSKLTHNITKDIPYAGAPASSHAGFQAPRIILCGDIDNDHKLDLLIYGDQLKESGDNMGFLILFLSSGAENNQLVRKVSEWAFKASCEG